MSKKNINLDKLREKIKLFFKEELGSNNVCLLDLPNYNNPGDQLIWEGEESLFNQLDINIKYRASFHFFNPKMISKNDCILLHGGGNFGDLYYKHQQFREYIIEHFQKNKIIILPSTIHFMDKRKLLKSSRIFSKHPNLVICARDNKSFKILQENFKKNKIHLLPDMAFAIINIQNSSISSHKKKVLFLSRTDAEKSKITYHAFNFISNLDTYDWPMSNQNFARIFFELLFLYINKQLLNLLKLFGLSWDKRHDVYGILKFHSKDKQIKNAIALLSKYDLIITTRLHGHILACLLQIPNIVLDNSYGKNKYFYDTWIHDSFEHSYFAETPKDVRTIIMKNFSTHLQPSS